MEEATDRGCREEEKEEEKDDGGLWRMMTLQDQTPLSSPPLLSRRLSFFCRASRSLPFLPKRFFSFSALSWGPYEMRNEKQTTERVWIPRNWGGEDNFPAAQGAWVCGGVLRRRGETTAGRRGAGGVEGPFKRERDDIGGRKKSFFKPRLPTSHPSPRFGCYSPQNVLF